jgi:hypothetical protein
VSERLCSVGPWKRVASVMVAETNVMRNCAQVEYMSVVGERLEGVRLVAGTESTLRASPSGWQATRHARTNILNMCPGSDPFEERLESRNSWYKTLPQQRKSISRGAANPKPVKCNTIGAAWSIQKLVR